MALSISDDIFQLKASLKLHLQRLSGLQTIMPSNNSNLSDTTFRELKNLQKCYLYFSWKAHFLYKKDYIIPSLHMIFSPSFRSYMFFPMEL